ncbi:ABC transporter permease [Methylovirgula sp. 4M-Z18]|uniref:ABC transporter permease n=1 Tax=Methylovirgula sp. 4M-Z18 TaxID=2293567 RepID=UPI000E2EF7AB|nr:ABC transporter permease [Methylovirgula sp. 4M-Z18]RFB79873.1 ABC transporter permease [Methylovirgula sp. 4M-Z18]
MTYVASERTVFGSRALAGIVAAFNTNKASWVGLVGFLAVVLVVVIAPLFGLQDPTEQDVFAKLGPPSAEHWFGTDYFGRDIFSRLIYGGQISLFIGFTSTLIAMVAGSLIGMVAGWYGGRFDVVIMQAMDVLLAFPSLILGLLIVAMLGPSIANIIWAIALTSIPSFARIARSPTIALKEREFVDACRALGFSDMRIVLGHILPNIVPEILVIASLWLGNAIRTEASLAFVGLSIKVPTPTWGGMIEEGFQQILDSVWIVLAPSLAILIVTFALNLLGDGLRDAVDPKLRGEG